MNQILFVYLRTIFMAKMRNDKKYTARHEQLARLVKVWGHSVRIAIVQFLAKQNTCYFGGIHELPITKATVFQHLKELKNPGLMLSEIGTPKIKDCINKKNGGLLGNCSMSLWGSAFAKKNCC